MILIAHRGNLEGPSSEENHPDQIMKALSLGFDVEVDVWMIDNKFYLGHDEPQYELENTDLLMSPSMWCHAKNIDALYYMIQMDVHCFWHEEDDITITSKGYMWTYPGKLLTPRSICVMPEVVEYGDNELKRCHGICTDYPYEYKKLVENSDVT